MLEQQTQCTPPTTLGVNTRPSWSVRPAVMRRSTISSRAELEGAQTCAQCAAFSWG